MVENLRANAGDAGDVFDFQIVKILWGSPLQYFCLENPMNIGSWWATFYGVTKSLMQLILHTLHQYLKDKSPNPFSVGKPSLRDRSCLDFLKHVFSCGFFSYFYFLFLILIFFLKVINLNGFDL